MGLKSVIPSTKPFAPTEKDLYPPGEVTKVAFKQKVENIRKVAEIQKETDKISETTEITEPGQIMGMPKTASKSTVFQKSSFQELAKEKITHENPRLLGYPNLLNLFVEILFYRWSGKKKKDGYIQATINQISVGIQLTEEESNAVMLDDNPV